MFRNLLFLGIIGCLSMTACGAKADTKSEPLPALDNAPEEIPHTETESPSASGMESSGTENILEDTSEKILIAYFSCTGNTKILAETIGDAVSGELYEIVPAIPYTGDDLNYNNADSRANQEQNNPADRPEIALSEVDISDYDTIFIGYPIWWGQAPKIISTFLESRDFSGKTVIPFCTSGSSGIGSSDTNLHSLLPDTVTWLEGRRFSSNPGLEELDDWLNNLGILSSNTD